jgi:hypothetical protein
MSGDVLDRNWDFFDISLLVITVSYNAREAVKNFSCSERLMFKLTVADYFACHLGARASRIVHQANTSLRSGSIVW